MLVTVFSDASVSGDLAGCGWWFKSETASANGADSLYRRELTVPEAELWGIITAIKAARLAHEGLISLVVQCDSLAALSSLHARGHRWAKTSILKQGPRKQLSKFEKELLHELNSLKGLKDLWLKHVKGHTEKRDARSFINHKTDRAASLARQSLTPPSC